MCTHLLQARARLFEQAERYRHLWLRETVFSTSALALKREEHAHLVSLILDRNAAAASHEVRAHLLTPVSIITEVLQARGMV